MPDTKKVVPRPRDRLLDVASGLFYREGITSIGVDRILLEANVTRTTLYRHFGGKEGLIVAYLKREDEQLREAFAAAENGAESPGQLLALAIDGIALDAARHHTRGCPFINAAAEYPEAAGPVRQVVADHREWFRASLERYLTAGGRADAAEKADELVMLRDAVLVGSYLDQAETVQQTYGRLARSVAGLS
ncbi:TetR/AcrR family transcriptional regulator [Gryllotalpicola protaetiae]|uniref:TetR/AcrR family transcriptional regulator n=1 Tax=Gryllotalpicola protaetiae TaxID=2419771 RepID=UPI001FEB874D|nr:TetR/AcrR family transcriptional regulator [Gryllotalpicola protaetiae]